MNNRLAAGPSRFSDNMKSIVLDFMHIFQILILLFILTGCGVNQEIANTNFVPNVFTKDDFALYDSQNELMVNIGMQRQEVEKVFGKHVDTIDFLGVYEYDGFKVHY